MKPNLLHAPAQRRGTVVVLTAVLMVAMMLILGFAVDYGFLLTAKTELQRAADSAALAASWELIGRFDETAEYDARDAAARDVAIQYAGLNVVARQGPNLDRNDANSPDGDIVIGYLSDFSDPNATLDTSDPAKFNAVRVRIRRTNAINGEVPFFFGRALGAVSQPVICQATAAVMREIGGFRTPDNGENLPILPLALDEQKWEAMLNGQGSDSYAYDPNTGAVTSGSDGEVEANLFPDNQTPGNYGTVDIGNPNNSTSDLRRQIRDGISPSDLEFHGGELTFNELGEMYLNGDTGISAAIQTDLQAIVGQTRIIPVFREVNGPGNNATFTIVKFVGVRIMSADLNGSMKNKRVIVQPADVVLRGGIPKSPGEQTTTTYYVSSPATLVY